ncbi:MAG: Brp/Blh family beta-carotene 15,15'-dioxygenase [Janthinobacterium lividum]
MFPTEGPVLLLASVLVGPTHGGLDHVVARDVFTARHRKPRWLPFLIGYLGLAVAILVAWCTFASGMLIVFLLLSIVHFGAEDASASGMAGSIASIPHGCVPIVVPALFHPQPSTCYSPCWPAGQVLSPPSSRGGR